MGGGQWGGPLGEIQKHVCKAGRLHIECVINSSLELLINEIRVSIFGMMSPFILQASSR